MTNQQHPITPPPELVQQWILDKQLGEFYSELNDPEQYFATQAAQWGADQELEACCEWLHWQNLATHSELIPSLRAARRPKLPSLKERALALIEPQGSPARLLNEDQMGVIRRALEQLPDQATSENV
jgi:hypothetical protein